MTDRTLFVNGHFHVPGSEVSAVLVEAGVIRQLFHADSVLPTDAQRLDLHGAWLYPGFTDTHTHSFEGGLYSGGVDLAACSSISEVLQLMSEGLDALSSGETLFVWRLDENQLLEKRFPTLMELDKLSGRHVILLRRIDGHSCMLNTFGRKLIPALSSSPEILRGVDNDKAVHYLHAQLSESAILKAYHNAAQIALCGGFSSIHTMIGDANISNTHYKLLAANLGSFPVNYIIYPQSFNIESALELGATRVGGCILADGSLGSHTAALSVPYADQATNGTLYQTDQYWVDFISRAHKERLQVAVHCIGDRAIKQINDVYLHLAETDPADLRHQLIHAELCPDSLVQEIAASGAVAVMQPAFDHYWGGETGFYQEVLGKDRARQMNRFRSLSDQGVPVTFGSDWYITELDALRGLHAAIHHHNPQERLSPCEAISAYTEKAAWLSHDEDIRAKIKTGLEADFTVVDKDLSQSWSPQDTKVLAVIKHGKLVYNAAKS